MSSQPPADTATHGGPRGVLVVACGALARELRAVVDANRLSGLRLEYLPAGLHNTPERIPAAVEERLVAAAGRYDQVFVGYGDCGTGGALDAVLERHGAQRLPGSHCYEFFSGQATFARLHDAEPGTFYLTDFLVRQFDRLVWKGLGLDRWPHLRDDYFGNYTRLVYLSQFPTPRLLADAQHAADRIGLRFEHVPVGTGVVAPMLLSIGRPAAAGVGRGDVGRGDVGWGDVGRADVGWADVG